MENFAELYCDIMKDMAESLYHDIINNPISNKLINYNDTIDFKFIAKEDLNFNACVTHENNTDYLIMNTGVRLIIEEYMYAIFARSDLFMEIGNSNKEINRKFVSSLLDENNIFDMPTPIDKERINVAQLISHFGLRYIVCHELGHLVNGHAFLLNELTDNFTIHMHSTENMDKDKKITPLDRRTLEYDADAFATTRGIHNIMNILIENKQYSWPKCIQSDKYKLFELWGFAVHTIFLFFDFIYKNDYSENSFYLPNQAREIANINSATANIKYLYTNDILVNLHKIEIDFDEIKKKLTTGLLKAEHCFNLFFQTEFNLLTLFHDTKYNHYVNQILYNWNTKLKSKLCKYSRTILS